MEYKEIKELIEACGTDPDKLREVEKTIQAEINQGNILLNYHDNLEIRSMLFERFNPHINPIS